MDFDITPIRYQLDKAEISTSGMRFNLPFPKLYDISNKAQMYAPLISRRICSTYEIAKQE